MKFRTAGWMIALMVFGALAGPASAAPTPRDILGSELLVKDYLEKLDVPPGRVRYVGDERLEHAFPHYLFFVAVYPLADQGSLPVPLKRVNLFSVAPDGRVRLHNAPAEWVELFRIAFRPGKGEERCKEAVRAALLLLQAVHPVYKFTFADEEIRITTDARGAHQGVGKLIVAEGGSGFIEAVLTLDRKCDLVKLVPTVTLTPGKTVVAAPTSVEVATAEKVVKARLEEAKLSVDPVRYVNDPVLLRTFPGYLFFVVPAPASDREDPVAHMNVMVVGPDGKPVSLFEGNMIGWFNSLFGPATNDPHLKTGLTSMLRVLELRFPSLKFSPSGDPEITTDDGGHRVIVSKTPAVGAAGRKWYLEVKLMFGKRGRLAAWWYWIRPVRT